MKLVKFLIVVVLAAAIGGAAYYYVNKLYVTPQKEVKAQPTATPPPPPDPGLEPLKNAKALYEQHKLPEARLALEELLVRHPESRSVPEAKQMLGEINADVFFSNRPDENKVEYKVQRGDSLFKIASKFKSSAELIMRSNNLESTMLQIGQELLVPQSQFSVFINASERTVTLYNYNRFFREYQATSGSVAVPSGGVIETRVAEKMAWRNGKPVAFDSKDYLGSTRWIRIAAPGYDLYTDWTAGGEPERKDMPTPASGLGLPPEQMEELHTLVNRGTEVYVQ
jgi:LysM repeat protein